MVHFVILVVSTFIFLLSRDRFQQLFDRIFLREPYNITRIVSTFENKFSDIYDFDLLTLGIANYIKKILSSESFWFAVKTEDKIYRTAFLSGLNYPEEEERDLTITQEMNDLIERNKIFSVKKIKEIPSYLNKVNGELIIPLKNGDNIFGFFVLGKKIGHRSYSPQDIEVLNVLTQRVVSMFYTAKLYQDDLNRKLMLEQERTRIARDIHDDVGASLTRISIMSEIVKKTISVPKKTERMLSQISDSCRVVTQEMTQIIWALSPRNDNFESLAGYVRSFAVEFLGPLKINCHFEYPDDIHHLKFGAEKRRNIFLSIREALNNVAKHSKASNVSISFGKDGGWLTVSVTDDGNGFNSCQQKSRGNGLLNINKRMKIIGGKSRIKSQVGCGADVMLLIPV